MFIEDKKDKVFIPQTQNTITANDYNQIKNEIQECISLAGLTPTKDVIQLPQALKILTAQSGAEEVAKIEAAGQEQLDAVNTAGQTQTAAVNAAGQTQMNNINTAGAQAVQNAQEAAATATSKAAEAADSAAAANSASGAATSKANAAAASAAEAETAKTDAQSAQTAAEAAKTAAQTAQSAAETAKTQAASSASAAANSASAASQSAQECQDLADTLGNTAKSDLSNVTDISASSAVQTALDAKAAVDLSNGTKATQSNINNIMPDAMDYVVDSYSDDAGNWYRVYKSGWLEQGGQLTNNSIGWHTVTFLKPFSIVYNLINSLVDAPVVPPTVDTLGPKQITNTNFMLYQASPGSNNWIAIGKGAENYV